MTQLQLFLFGSPRLERDGVIVTVDTRKAIALLSYLALTGQLHSRDTLATLFWPEYAQNQARANLRRTLSALAKVIGKALLEIDRENIGLVPGVDLWVDACRFQQLRVEASSHNHPAEELCPTCLPLLTEAVALYQADFMTGFNLSDSPNFEEWQFFQSESLRRELTWVLDRLTCSHSNRGEFDAAIDAAWRRVALDPLDESAQRQLMQLYAWAGQRNAALRQYQNLVRLLDEELGVPPSEETEALHQAIVENRLSPPPRKPESLPELLGKDNGTEMQKPTEFAELSQEIPELKSETQNPANNLPAQTKPFIGREAELGALSQMLADPNCRLLTLVGPGGVGKTRLAIEVASRQVEYFSDGVHFVSLAPLSGPDFVAPTIANALGLSLHGSGSLSQHLIHFLKEKQVLLVLDDIEQLLASRHLDATQSAASVEQKDNSFMLLSDLLQAAPHLKLLVTSRERLRLQGEWVFEIHGLPLPPLEPTQGFEGYSAVNLFIQNARRVQHNFNLTSLERPAVARICQLVDGLPLGIELAAAWTHLLSCDEIAQEIERNLDFLATTDRDAMWLTTSPHRTTVLPNEIRSDL